VIADARHVPEPARRHRGTDRRTHFRFLETLDEHFAYDLADPPPQGRWAISGLGLPSDILSAVYAGNARRLIPGLV